MATGARVWLEFVAPVLGAQHVFEGRPLAYFGITAGYPLLGMLVMGAIVGAWHAANER